MKLNINILEASGININELRAIGGGAKSRIWIQLKANILNKPIAIVKVTEAGCLGAAMLAYTANEKVNIEKLAANWVKIISVIDPDPSYVGYYQDQFLKYKKLYSALKKMK